MRLHLYYLDSKWKAERRTANNYNLLVYTEDKTYKIFISPFYGYHRPEDIEVKRKSDIVEYVEYLKANGFTEED